MSEQGPMTPNSYDTGAAKRALSSKSERLAERHSPTALQFRYLDMKSGVGHCPPISEEVSWARLAHRYEYFCFGRLVQAEGAMAHTHEFLLLVWTEHLLDM
jgi:hypothetical protein